MEYNRGELSRVNMRQFSKHDVNKLTAKALTEYLPFQITNDGEVIAIIISPSDKAKYNGAQFVNKELRFSKANQAKGRMLTS